MDITLESSTKQYGFEIADYLVCGSVVLTCMGIGLYYAITGGRRQTTTDYLLGNRRLQIIPVALSFVVSFESSILMLGMPAEVYIYGFIAVLSTISNILTVSIFGSRVAVPIFHPLKITSAYEYLEMRYNHRGPRILCTIIGMLFYLFYMGIVLFGPALALQAVLGIPLTTSILAVVGAAMIYTALGGIRAVIWTDVLQCVVMTVGIISVIVQCTIYSGGLGSVWEINKKYKRLDVFEADPTIRHTIWTMVVGSSIRLCAMLFNQSSIQRISAVKTQREAKKILYISGPLFAIFLVLICIVGISMFSYFNAIGCDPLESKHISNPNQLVPFLIVRLFDRMPGMSGLYMAALFSATLSTLSSGLSSLSAQLTEDFVKPAFKNMSDVKATIIAKFSVILFGGISVCISFLIANAKGSLMQIAASMLTTFSGTVAGMFLFSIFCPWANTKGVMVGGITSLVFVFWLSVGQNFSTTLIKQPWLPHNPIDHCFVNQSSFNLNGSFPMHNLRNSPSLDNYEELINKFWRQPQFGLDKFYSVSYLWFPTIAIFVVSFVGNIVSLLQGYPDTKNVDVRYILPIGDTIFPYLPRRIRTYLNCGVPFHKREEWLKKLEENEEESQNGYNSDGVKQEKETCLNSEAVEEHYFAKKDSLIIDSVKESKTGIVIDTSNRSKCSHLTK